MTADADATYATEGDWLVVTVTGVCDGPWATALFRSVADAARTASVKAILVDAHAATGLLSVVDRFFMGETYALQRVLVPLAVVAEEPLADPGRFGAIVARNRGAVVEIFDDVPSARAWLEARASGAP